MLRNAIVTVAPVGVMLTGAARAQTTREFDVVSIKPCVTPTPGASRPTPGRLSITSQKR